MIMRRTKFLLYIIIFIVPTILCSCIGKKVSTEEMVGVPIEKTEILSNDEELDIVDGSESVLDKYLPEDPKENFAFITRYPEAVEIELGLPAGSLARDIENVTLYANDGSSITVDFDNADGLQFIAWSNEDNSLMYIDSYQNSITYHVYSLEEYTEKKMLEVVNNQYNYAQGDYDFEEMIIENNKKIIIDGKTVYYAKCSYTLWEVDIVSYILYKNTGANHVIVQIELYNNIYSDEQLFACMKEQCIKIKNGE